MLTDPETTDVLALLAGAGLAGPCELTPLVGGGNNRVYRVDCDGNAYLLKAYLHEEQPSRDRLGAEFSFARFAWDRGLRALPRPFACDRGANIALYEFIPGRKLMPDEIGADEVQQAVAFFRQLNRHRPHPDAAGLPDGAEACFTVSQHLACAERRVASLAGLEEVSTLDREAGTFIRHELAPAWERCRASVLAHSADWELAIDQPIPPEGRCLSPSDFGFHNAIRAVDGRLRFIDFEYAGWDDPAKSVCDFVCQPAVPMPGALAASFADGLLADFDDPPAHRRRVTLLLPVYRLKWCCIMLNDFLPAGDRRRRFANRQQRPDERKRLQLEKARTALRRIG